MQIEPSRRAEDHRSGWRQCRLSNAGRLFVLPLLFSWLPLFLSVWRPVLSAEPRRILSLSLSLSLPLSLSGFDLPRIPSHAGRSHSPSPTAVTCVSLGSGPLFCCVCAQLARYRIMPRLHCASHGAVAVSCSQCIRIVTNVLIVPRRPGNSLVGA